MLEQLLSCTGNCTAVTLAGLEHDDSEAMAKTRLKLLSLAGPSRPLTPGYLG